jgi:hypothetical protein
MDECFAVSKPVFLGEDRYEHDHHESRDPQDMRYFQRRLFWAWLLSGGSANYGGRWWVLHPYSQTGARPARSFHHPAHIYDQPLAGLDSVKVIRDFFEQRHVELAAFQPAHALASDPDRRDAVNAPKVMRRAGDEFLLYHPNATGAGRTMEVSASRTARVRLDLTSAPGRFSVEWVRALDGAALPGDAVQGGAVIELAAPWPGADIVLRMQRSQ